MFCLVSRQVHAFYIVQVNHGLFFIHVVVPDAANNGRQVFAYWTTLVAFLLLLLKGSNKALQIKKWVCRASCLPRTESAGQAGTYVNDDGVLQRRGIQVESNTSRFPVNGLVLYAQWRTGYISLLGSAYSWPKRIPTDLNVFLRIRYKPGGWNTQSSLEFIPRAYIIKQIAFQVNYKS